MVLFDPTDSSLFGIGEPAQQSKATRKRERERERYSQFVRDAVGDTQMMEIDKAEQTELPSVECESLFSSLCLFVGLSVGLSLSS